MEGQEPTELDYCDRGKVSRKSLFQYKMSLKEEAVSNTR
jgi:hypothetical protein